MNVPCGKATLGPDLGREGGTVWISVVREANKSGGYTVTQPAGCEGNLGGLILHELGHVFGLWHSGRQGAMMFPYVGFGVKGYTPAEAHHAQLAYRLGRGSLRCEAGNGWPLQVACRDTVANAGRGRAVLGPRPIVE